MFCSISEYRSSCIGSTDCHAQISTKAGEISSSATASFNISHQHWLVKRLLTMLIFRLQAALGLTGLGKWLDLDSSPPIVEMKESPFSFEGHLEAST